MRKKLLLIFLVCVAILFVITNIRNTMQRPFHQERVNNLIMVAKDRIENNNQLEITEVGSGRPVKGGGWGNHIYFKSYLSENQTVDFMIPPLQSIMGDRLVGKVSDPTLTSYQFGFSNFGVNLLYRGKYDGIWELRVISLP